MERAATLVTRALKATAVVSTLLLWTLNFGLIDLIDGFAGFVDEGRNQVLDAGWGAVFGIVLPLALLAQLRPRCRIAGLQGAAVTVAAIAAAAAAGREWRYLPLVAALAALCALLLALHPARSTFLVPGRASLPLVLLAAAAAVPCLVYARRAASAQRAGTGPADAVSNGLHHWTIMAALALTLPLLVLLAALGTEGRWIPAWGAGLGALAWGVACLLSPASAPGSEGHAWAWAAGAWALVVLAVPAVRPLREGGALARAPA